MKTHWLGFSVLILLAFLLAGCPPAEEAQKPDAAKAAQVAKKDEKAKEVDEEKKAEEAKAEEAKAEVTKAEEAKAEEKKAEKARVRTVDTSKLPPPRPPLEATPDLFEAKLAVTDQGMARMKEDGVPDDVLAALAVLKGREYANAREFLSAVRDAVGADKLADHQQAILRHSFSVNLETAAAFPGRTMSRLPATSFGVVFFEYDRSEIKAEFLETIKKNAQALLDNPDMRVTVEGHCDERGTTEYNLALGERRASAVKQAMIDLGVKPEQMQTVSFGEERPANPASNESAWSENRRSVLISAN